MAGLAIARVLALAGKSVLILEREAHFGTGTSSRNSEVIHAGIYYPQDSLKAKLCVEGKTMLYAFCDEFGVPFRRCGKLIVARDDTQIERLKSIQATARSCGVHDLHMLTRQEAAALEPAITCSAALLSPSTGIIDTHAYMQALLGSAEAHGAILVCNTKVVRIVRKSSAWSLFIEGTDEAVVTAQTIVNAAGLDAPTLAGSIEGFPARLVPELHLAKGNYFGYSGRTSFNRLIYPLPEPGGLGIHLTIDMAGRPRFGPDVEWIREVDYSVDPSRLGRFAEAIRSYWPAIEADMLFPDYAGIRPKLSGPNEPAADFLISGPEDHDVAEIINLFGIESPGITASLAIAAEVGRQLRVGG